jgi:uncharacterized protein
VTPPAPAFEITVRIAVIGTGISGLAAAWLLDREHDVHVFEQDHRLGGHTHTVHLERPDRAALPVDTGFIVYNEPTYPNLTRLFDELDVATAPSDMSWSLRCDACDLEYAGSPRGIAAQPRNLADPRYLRFVSDIVRFNRIGARLANDARTHRATIGHFTHTLGFSHEFTHHYLAPMAAAIWSTGTGPVLDFPLGTLLTFFDNHGLLGITSHHPWRTVVGGTSSYIPRLTASYRDRIRSGDAVVAVTRDPHGVDVRTAAGHIDRFDHVVIATHADQALGMLTDPTPREKELLGEWQYADNDTWLHTDTSLLPTRRAAWASWNYRLTDCRRSEPSVSLSYWMNRLQPLDTAIDHVVTLNPDTPPAPGTVLRRMRYDHPVFTPESVATQAFMGEIQGQRRTWYAGAHHRYGFHEDGLVSAIRVADRFGVRWPR